MGDDARQGGLAETGRAKDQRVIEGLAASARGGEKNRHLLANRRLADVLCEAPGPHGAVLGFLGVARRRGIDESIRFDHALLTPDF